MIEVSGEKSVAVVKLNRNVTNALSPELVGELAGVLEKLREDVDARAIVLTGVNEKFFSIGLDIPHLYDLSEKEFSGFYRAFNRLCLTLYTLPKPTVAAIRGHAIAGGTILALCCDYRVIAEGRNLMGLNEIKLGVPVPYPADCILRSIVGTKHARDVVESGDFFESDASLEKGMVDEVVPQADVMPRAMERAELLGSTPAEAYGRIKGSRTEHVEKRILAKLEEKERAFIDIWFSEEARGRLRKAIEKF